MRLTVAAASATSAVTAVTGDSARESGQTLGANTCARCSRPLRHRAAESPFAEVSLAQPDQGVCIPDGAVVIERGASKIVRALSKLSAGLTRWLANRTAIGLFERRVAQAEEDDDLVLQVRFRVLLSSVLAGDIGSAEVALAAVLAHPEELADPQAGAHVDWAQSASSLA